MEPELKAKWIEALRSGKYQQTQHRLKDDKGFCCLGVLCDVQGADFKAIRAKYDTLSLSQSPPEYLGTIGGACSTLVQMNDEGKSFAEIADYIEQNL